MTARTDINDNGANRVETLASDYVLGLLNSSEMEAAEAEMLTNSELKAAIAAWQDKLQPLNDTATPVEPSTGLWSRIAADTQPLAQATVLPFQRPRNVSNTAQKTQARGWNAWSGAAIGAIAASLIFFAGPRLVNFQSLVNFQTQPSRSAVAILLSPENKPGIMVEIYPGNRTVVVPLEQVSMPADRSLQVWTLIDPAKGPVSIGLMPELQTASLKLDGQAEVHAGQLYEISLEPRAGSPTGRPTGPVLFKGYATLSKL